MRRSIPFTALLLLTGAPLVLAGALPAAGAVRPTGFAFGRLGGNIRPYTVTIANTGVVHSSGAVVVGRTHVAPVQLAALNRIATETQFTMLPASTSCRGTLPDVASTYVRVGARTVRVHGTCVPGYQRMLKALKASVRLSN
jgi:hypothetical protein